MMLSTVSSKDFGVEGGDGRVWARVSCGQINDKTQSTMPARRRCLVFILFLKGRQSVFAPFVFSSRLCVKFRDARAFHAKAQRNSKGAKRSRGALRSRPTSCTAHTTSSRISSRQRAFQSWRCQLYQPCLLQWQRLPPPVLPASCPPPTGGLLSLKDYGRFPSP
jgi:hypothetical protein